MYDTYENASFLQFLSTRYQTSERNNDFTASAKTLKTRTTHLGFNVEHWSRVLYPLIASQSSDQSSCTYHTYIHTYECTAEGISSAILSPKSFTQQSEDLSGRNTANLITAFKRNTNCVARERCETDNARAGLYLQQQQQQQSLSLMVVSWI